MKAISIACKWEILQNVFFFQEKNLIKCDLITTGNLATRIKMQFNIMDQMSDYEHWVLSESNS